MVNIVFLYQSDDWDQPSHDVKFTKLKLIQHSLSLLIPLTYLFDQVNSYISAIVILFSSKRYLHQKKN